MSDSYTEMTVNTLLPLLPHHHCLLRMFSDLGDDMSPADWIVDSEDAPAQIDLDKLKVWANERYVSAEFSQEAVDLAVAGMQEIFADDCLFADGRSLSATKWSSRDEQGRPVWFLYCEENLEDWVWRYLNWAIQSLPEDVRAIEAELSFGNYRRKPGEAGGGAWFITRTEGRTMTTGAWLSEQRRAIFGDRPEET